MDQFNIAAVLKQAAWSCWQRQTLLAQPPPVILCLLTSHHLKRVERADGRRELCGVMVERGCSEYRQLKPESLGLIPRDFWLLMSSILPHTTGYISSITNISATLQTLSNCVNTCCRVYRRCVGGSHYTTVADKLTRRSIHYQAVTRRMIHILWVGSIRRGENGPQTSKKCVCYPR